MFRCCSYHRMAIAIITLYLHLTSFKACCDARQAPPDTASKPAVMHDLCLMTVAHCLCCRNKLELHLLHLGLHISLCAAFQRHKQKPHLPLTVCAALQRHECGLHLLHLGLHLLRGHQVLRRGHIRQWLNLVAACVQAIKVKRVSNRS